jgi:uncharacterized membrane protein HdeD (DUF308 family)
MLWSGSKPLTVVRENMWGFLMFAGVAWLAISWCVMRLEPSDVASVAGPVVLFGALTEAVRALSQTRTWWLNAGMAVLFAVTGVVLWAAADSSSYTTPAALLGWYLMVRGAADVAVSMMTRETDRIWGLLMVVGVLENGLGFFAASPLSRSADLVVTVLGGLALARGVSDLVASLRLREAAGPGAGILDLPPERAAGVAGYSAGLSDYEAAPVRTGPRHRASSNRSSRASSAAAMSDLSKPAISTAGSPATDNSSAAPASPAGSDTPAASTAGGRAGETGEPGSFHDEVLRTTADLDAMLALAGVTGAGVAAGLAEHFYDDLPEVPDTPEGAMPAEEKVDEEISASRTTE